jgi:hypothetical protein
VKSRFGENPFRGKHIAPVTIIVFALVPLIMDEQTRMILFIVQPPKEPRKAKLPFTNADAICIFDDYNVVIIFCRGLSAFWAYWGMILNHLVEGNTHPRCKLNCIF